MSATVTVIQSPYFVYDGLSLTGQVEELTLPFSIDEIEATASGDGAHVFVPGLEKASASVKLFRTIAIDNKMWATKGTSVTIALRKANAARSATNPEYGATAFFNSYPLLAGKVGDPDKVEIALSMGSQLSRTTTST